MDFHTEPAAARRLARSLLPSDHDVDDVVQEAWLRALTSPTPIRDNERGWFQVVAWRLARRSLERGRRRLEREHAVARPEASPRTPFHDLAQREATRALARAVDGLREPYRSALRGRYLEERTYAEMALELGLSEASVRSRVKRGLEELRARMAGGRAGVAAWLALALLLLPDRRRVLPMAATAAVTTALVVSLVALWGSDRADAARGDDATAMIEHDGRATQVASRTPTGAPSPPGPVDSARQDPVEATAVAVAAPVAARGLSGIVRDVHGTPAAAAAAWVEDEAGERRRVACDGEGGFALEEVPERGWIWAEKPGHVASVRHRLDTIGPRQRGCLQLALGHRSKPWTLHVVDAAGLPVADAEVRMASDARPDWGLQGTIESAHADRRGTTDAQGRFETWPLAGRVSVAVSHPRHGGLLSPAPARPGAGNARAWTVQLPPAIALEGRVLDAAGRGLPDARVTWRPRLPEDLDPRIAQAFGPVLERATTSASDGAFRLAGLAPGPYELWALAPDGAAHLEGTLDAEPETSEAVLRVDERWSVRGRVVADSAADGAAPSVAAWEIRLTPHGGPASGGPARRAVASDAGEFVLHGVRGACELTVHAADEPAVAWARTLARAGDRGVVLEPSDRTRLSAYVSGRLLGAAERGAWVEVLSDALPQPLRVDPSATDGSWTTPALPPGTYDLEGVLPGLGVFELQRVHLGVAQHVQLEDRQPPAARDLHVRFRWRDADDRRLTFLIERETTGGTRMRLTPGNGSRARGMALRDDGFVVHGLLPGTWRVTLRPNGLPTFRDEVEVLDGLDGEVVLPDAGECFIRILVQAPRPLAEGESRTVEVLEDGGRRRALDPGDRRHRGENAWLGRRLDPVDSVLLVRTSGGLEGRATLSAEDIRLGRTVKIALR